VEEPHKVGEAGRNTKASSGDEAKIRPVSRGGYLHAALEISRQVVDGRDQGYGETRAWLRGALVPTC
jgi:hypothetical protein